jgi:hypothetical protein
VIACRITGAEMTSLSSTMAKGAPTFAAVYSPKARAPDGLKRKVTTGRPFWSKLGWLSVRSSPVTTGVWFEDVEHALFVQRRQHLWRGSTRSSALDRWCG